MLPKPKRFQIDQIFWIHAKVALIICGICYIFNPPPGPLAEMGTPLTVAIGLFAIFGSIIGIIGLSMTSSRRQHVRRKALAIEVSGLILAICGPLSYFVIQVALIHDDGLRTTVAAFWYAFSAFMFARIVSVMRAITRRGL